MYSLLNAHFATIVIVIASIMVTPLYIFATYVYSGASINKGLLIAVLFLIFGALMFWVCLSDSTNKVGPIGQLIVPVAWLTPSLLLFYFKDWFLSEPLSQKWLVGLQIFRIIGGVFLIEMALQNIPGIFAYPAGIGDIIVGLLAAVTLLLFANKGRIPSQLIILVIILGLLDFLSAFFFGITSSQSSLQLFYPEITNQMLLFPTGMIPLFLVPYAIFFHALSLLNYLKFEKSKDL